MPEDRWRKERLGFRILDITEEQLRQVQNLCPSTTADNPKHKAMKRFPGRVAFIPLSKNGDYSWIKSFIKNEGLPVGSYDIFMSLVTASDSEIIETPQFVLDLVHETSAKLLFSFTIVFPDDEGEEESVGLE